MPASSWVTFATGVAGIGAGYAISVASKSAAYIVMADLDSVPDPTAPRLGFRHVWARRFAAVAARAPPLPTLVWAEIRRLAWVAWQARPSPPATAAPAAHNPPLLSQAAGQSSPPPPSFPHCRRGFSPFRCRCLHCPRSWTWRC